MGAAKSLGRGGFASVDVCVRPRAVACASPVRPCCQSALFTGCDLYTCSILSMLPSVYCRAALQRDIMWDETSSIFFDQAASGALLDGLFERLCASLTGIVLHHACYLFLCNEQHESSDAPPVASPTDVSAASNALSRTWPARTPLDPTSSLMADMLMTLVANRRPPVGAREVGLFQGHRHACRGRLQVSALRRHACI